MLGSASILIVDSDALLRLSIVRGLTASGHRVQGTGSVDELVDSLPDGLFDLILLDLLTSGLDGLARIRLLQRYSETPVIVLSGRCDSAWAAMGALPGLLPKPFSLHDLNAAIERTLSGPRF